MYYIYAHRNKINGKIYIGQTKQNPDKRWGKNGKRYLEKKKDGNYVHEHFARAIIKYGWENFEHYIIFENLTKQQADDIEKEMILRADSTNSEKGYNIAKGGADGGSPWTEEQRIKFHNSRLGHAPSQESINTIKETQGTKCYIKEKPEAGVFRCAKDLADFLGVTKGAVKHVLTGKSETCKGYHIIRL